jgi:transposase-like protein
MSPPKNNLTGGDRKKIVRYSEEFKQSAVQKLLSRGNRTVTEIIEELGITSPTLYQWRNDFAKVRGMKKPSSPQDRPLSEKNKSIYEYDALPVEKRGEYLRKNGIHEDNLTEWRSQIEKALLPAKRSSEDRQIHLADQKVIQQLKQDLLRKDKALKEMG